jgi:hypothetical protein
VTKSTTPASAAARRFLRFIVVFAHGFLQTFGPAFINENTKAAGFHGGFAKVDTEESWLLCHLAAESVERHQHS